MRLRFLQRMRQPPRTVVLYVRSGCHLCDDARARLRALERRFPHTVEEIDIRSDPDLTRRYDIRIPVLTVDGGPEVDAPLTPEKIRAALQSRQDTAS